MNLTVLVATLVGFFSAKTVINLLDHLPNYNYHFNKVSNNLFFPAATQSLM